MSHWRTSTLGRRRSPRYLGSMSAALSEPAHHRTRARTNFQATPSWTDTDSVEVAAGMRIALVLQQPQPREFVLRVCVCGEVVAPYRHRTPQTVSADRLRLRAADALTRTHPR